MNRFTHAIRGQAGLAVEAFLDVCTIKCPKKATPHKINLYLCRQPPAAEQKVSC